MKVVVTEEVFRKAKEVFCRPGALEIITAPAAEHDLATVIRNSEARYAIVGAQPYRSALYDSLPPGGVVARFGVGRDSIDKYQATARGIFCTNTPGTLAVSVAELTFGLILMLARHLATAANGVRAGEWKPELGTELRDKRLAVIGCGPIGAKVAGIASHGFGMDVVGCTTHPGAEVERDTRFTRVTTQFEEAVADADFVSLHIPASAGNLRFMNARRLALLPARACLINTSRGAVVDESAVYDALTAGALAGAALDVFEVEPYIPHEDKDLRTLPNVLMVPHIGSTTTEACNRMAERALRNVIAAEEKRYSSMDLLNPEVLFSGNDPKVSSGPVRL